MNELQNIQPHIYKNFQNGLHCTRRSDRFWAGLSTFWMIEQALLRSVKTSDELTRGKGLSEMQRLVWLMSTTPCRPLLVLGIPMFSSSAIFVHMLPQSEDHAL